MCSTATPSVKSLLRSNGNKIQTKMKSNELTLQVFLNFIAGIMGGMVIWYSTNPQGKVPTTKLVILGMIFFAIVLISAHFINWIFGKLGLIQQVK